MPSPARHRKPRPRRRRRGRPASRGRCRPWASPRYVATIPCREIPEWPHLARVPYSVDDALLPDPARRGFLGRRRAGALRPAPRRSAACARCSRSTSTKKPEAELTREEMLAFYDGKIAQWWIPGDVVFVDELPHTATGKLMKTTLRERFSEHLAQAVKTETAALS
ncbi:MAG: AMP-binding enzyme [Usitatibacter sp.]